MSEQVNAEKSKSENEGEAITEQATGGAVRSALFLTIAIIVAAVGVAGYLATTVQGKLQLNEANSRSLQSKIQALEKTTIALNQQLEALRARLNKTHAQIEALLNNFSVLYQQKNSDAGWRLTEIKHLLLTASHRLVLARDVDTALVALQTADRKLRELPDPGLIPVREQLLADINRLKATTAIDFTGLALYLSDLAKRVQELPLKTSEPAATTAAPARDPSPDNESGWQWLKSAVWQELKTLVVVKRAGEGGAATLFPEERYFLYQNLRLQLEAARVAVLSRDGEQFQDAVETSMDWLSRYFNTSHNNVSAALDSLEGMTKIDFDEKAPVINQSLSALEDYLTAQTKIMINEEVEQ